MDFRVEFFIAPDDETAAQVKGFGARGAFESLPGGIYDPSEAVVEWESLFADTSRQALMQAGEPRIITEITNDGCYVFAVSDRLTTALARPTKTGGTRRHTSGPTGAKTTARTSAKKRPSPTSTRWLLWLARLPGKTPGSIAP